MSPVTVPRSLQQSKWGLEAFAPLDRDKPKQQRGSREALAVISRPASVDRSNRFYCSGSLKFDRHAVPLSREIKKVLTSWKK